MRRPLLALAILAVLATACGSRTEPPAPSPSPTRTTPRPSPSPSPSASPSPTPEPVSALTGIPVDDPAVLERPVLAVKIDNAPQAKPQQGLELAEIVLEELVEGGTTRFVALYAAVDPGVVGPVRSGRDVDADLLPPFAPVVGISGAADPTHATLRAAGLRYFSEGTNPGFRRERSRRAPYNLFVAADALWADAGDLPPAAEPWPFDAQVPERGDLVESARLKFASQSSSSWTWDAATKTWLRGDGGKPHLAASGEQVAAANVVIARVPVHAGGGVDVKGSPTQEIGVVGEGEALVLRDGRAIPATWRKPSADAQFEWRTETGAVLPLRPGATWVALLPIGALLETTPVPSPTPSASASPAAAG